MSQIITVYGESLTGNMQILRSECFVSAEFDGTYPDLRQSLQDEMTQNLFVVLFYGDGKDFPGLISGNRYEIRVEPIRSRLEADGRVWYIRRAGIRDVVTP